MRGSRQYAYRPDEGAEGLICHHTCHNPSCTNPEHIEMMTQSEHMKRHGAGGDWGQADKTHCPQGHPYDEANTYHWRNERHCRECRKAAKRRYRAAKQGW